MIRHLDDLYVITPAGLAAALAGMVLLLAITVVMTWWTARTHYRHDDRPVDDPIPHMVWQPDASQRGGYWPAYTPGRAPAQRDGGDR